MGNISFEWDSSLDLGIPEIDEQHKRLFEIGNKINEIIDDKSEEIDQNKLWGIVMELKEFTGYHFYTEEKMMDECKFQKRSEHKKKHEELINNLFSSKVLKQNNDPRMALIAARSLILDVIWTHVSVDDKEFGRAYRRYLKLFKHMEDKKKKTRELIDEKFGTIIKEFDMSLFYLSWDQTCEGHSVLVTREPKNSFFKLTSLERNTFVNDMQRAVNAVRKTFNPSDTQIIYATDVDHHVAVHIIPKFVDDKNYGKILEVDPDFERWSEEKYEALALEISRNM